VRETNPRHAIAIYLAFNALVTILALFTTASWTDFFTVTGYWVTFTGLLVAFVELYRARTFADQIRDAVVQENARQRGFHYRHCLERARTMLSSAQQHVLSKQWSMAAARLVDLTGYLSYVNSISPAVDNRWLDYAASAQAWSARFGDGSNGKGYVYNRTEWQQVTLSVLQQLDGELAPFQFGEGVGNDLV
jgi:hypothetical protein